MSRKAVIHIEVGLDEENFPAKITWSATEAPSGEPQHCHAMMLSLWDPEKKNSLSINLWTPEMTVQEMNIFVLQSLIRAAETYRTATQGDEIADLLDSFARTLAERIERTGQA